MRIQKQYHCLHSQFQYDNNYGRLHVGINNRYFLPLLSRFPLHHVSTAESEKEDAQYSEVVVRR